MGDLKTDNTHMGDPQVSTSQVSDLPTKFSQKLRWVGPSFVVAAAAVGSGEIINATRLGAIAGLAVLWAVFWGVFLKGFIQQEIGRYSITTKKTITQGFADIPGPKLYGKSWFLWLFLVLLALVVLVIVAGIGGAIGGVLHSISPVFSASTWGIIANIAIIPILLTGIFIPSWNVYKVVERIQLIVVIALTFLMLYVAFIAIPLSGKFSYSIGDLIGGMGFQIPSGSLLITIAVLGTIGAGIELIYYSPWLVSKGYANQAHFEGDNDSQKKERLKAWLSVMRLDTWLGVVATLLVSVAFFITGSVVLHGLGDVPKGVNLVEEISLVFTQVLGSGFFMVFMIGALAGLYSTALGIADGSSRMAADIKNELMKKPKKKGSSNTLYAWMVVIIVLSWIIFYKFISAPAVLIAVGGAALSLLFPLYGLALLYLNRQIPKGFQMGWIIKSILVICFLLFSSLWFMGKIL